MKSWKLFTEILFVCLFSLAQWGCAKSEPVQPPEKSSVAHASLTVSYFHRSIRCPSCNKIEALTQEAVEEAFPEELQSGAMTWRTINIDEAPYKHFEADYNLQAQSVVLSEVCAGKETRWKNLDKVWDLLSDDETFVRYIQEEVRGFEQSKE